MSPLQHRPSLGRHTSCDCQVRHDNVIQVVMGFDLTLNGMLVENDVEESSLDISRVGIQYRNNAIITRTINGVKAKPLLLLFSIESPSFVYEIALDCSLDRHKIDWLSVQDQFIVDILASNGMDRLYFPNPCKDFLKQLTKRLRNMPHWDAQTAEALLEYADARYHSGSNRLSRLEN